MPDLEPLGNGRYFDFFATKEEIEEALCGLPEEEGPYLLIAPEFDEVMRAWRPWHRSPGHGNEDFGPAGITRIWAKAITNEFALDPADSILDRAAFHGMPKLSYSLPDRSGTALETRFTMTTKHRRISTGEVFVHERYLAVYIAFVRQIKSRLAWRTLMRDIDGNEHRGAPMTKSAKAEYDAGYPYRGRPTAPLRSPAKREARR